MEVYQCIRSRRTVREFKPDPVPEDVIMRILQAGRWSPSSSNTQCWHFIVIQERDTLTKLAEICSQGRFIGQAPVAIAIVMENAPRPPIGRRTSHPADGTDGLVPGCRHLLRRNSGPCPAGNGQGTSRHRRRDGVDYHLALRLPRRGTQGQRHPEKAHGRDSSPGTLRSALLVAW